MPHPLTLINIIVFINVYPHVGVSQGCQSNLIKDGGYKYFISVLADTSMQYEYRTMAAFIISSIVKDNPKGKVSHTHTPLTIFMTIIN